MFPVDDPVQTPAHRTTDTRFGPRPAHAGLAPGRSLAARTAAGQGSPWLRYVGIGILAAAGTAGAVLAARKVAAMIAEDDGGPRQRWSAPSYDRPSHDRPAHDGASEGRPRRPSRRRPSKPLARSITDTANDLTAQINGFVSALSLAVNGFQAVSRNASGAMRDFNNAAQTVRGLLDTGSRTLGTLRPTPTHVDLRDRRDGQR